MMKTLSVVTFSVFMLSGCSAVQSTVGFAADVATFPIDIVTDVIGAETSQDREIKKAKQQRDSALEASRQQAIRLQRNQNSIVADSRQQIFEAQRDRDLFIEASRQETAQLQRDRDIAIAASQQQTFEAQRDRDLFIEASRQETAQLQRDRDLAIAASVRESNRAQSATQELNQMLFRINSLEAQAKSLENSLATQRMSFDQERSQRIALQQTYSSLNTAVERAEIRAKRIGIDLDISPDGSRVRRIN